MKKISTFLLAALLMVSTIGYAQPVKTEGTDATTVVNDSANKADELTTSAATEEEEIAGMQKVTKTQKGSNVLKQKFIEGGPGWMLLPLLCLIFGLAIAIERLVTYGMSSINSNKFLAKIEDLVKGGNVNEAKELCKKTKNPVASVCYQALDRQGSSPELVEKAVVNYGGVELGKLEKGLTWLALFIALAPMLGFLGTVVGMIRAFDDIAKAGDISPTVVASGMKMALLTTVAGLIVAIVLQIFSNLIASILENTVNQMDEATVNIMDVMYENKLLK